MLHFFIADIEPKVHHLPPTSIIFTIFYKRLTPREQRKLILTRFNLENILSSLALETGTVNNNLIITSASLQPFLLCVVKILRHVTRYKKESCLHILLIRIISPKSREQILYQLLLRKSEAAHIWKKLDYFTFNVFSLFAGDDLKMSDLELYFRTVVRYKCFCKNLYFA